MMCWVSKLSKKNSSIQLWLLSMSACHTKGGQTPISKPIKAACDNILDPQLDHRAQVEDIRCLDYLLLDKKVRPYSLFLNEIFIFTNDVYSSAFCYLWAQLGCLQTSSDAFILKRWEQKVHFLFACLHEHPYPLVFVCWRDVKFQGVGRF